MSYRTPQLAHILASLDGAVLSSLESIQMTPRDVPAEYFPAARTEAHVRKEPDGGVDYERHPWQTTPVGLQQYSRRTAVQRQTVCVKTRAVRHNTFVVDVDTPHKARASHSTDHCSLLTTPMLEYTR